MNKAFLTLGCLTLISTAAMAEHLLEFQLTSTNEIVSKEALPSAGVLATEMPYWVDVPQNDGSVEKVERFKPVFANLPQPEVAKTAHQYRFPKDIAAEARFPERILIEGLEQKDAVYTRTTQSFAHVETEKGLYRSAEPATRKEMVEESKLLEEINQFRKDNGVAPLAFSVTRLTPFSPELTRIPKVGNLSQVRRLNTYPPTIEGQRFFRGEKQVSFVEFHKGTFLDPVATEIDLAIGTIEREKGKLIDLSYSGPAFFVLLYTPE